MRDLGHPHYHVQGETTGLPLCYRRYPLKLLDVQSVLCFVALGCCEFPHDFDLDLGLR